MKGIDRLQEIAEDVGRTVWLRDLGAALSDTADAIEGGMRDLSGYESDVLAWVEENGGLEAIKARMMPEGMEWPRFEDGEPVRIGDEVVDEAGEIVYRVSEIAFSDGYGTCLRYEDQRDGNSYNFIDGLEPGERVKRPAVLAADGEPLEVGQTVWSVKYGTEYKVDEIRDTTDDDDEPCKIIRCSNDELHIYCAYLLPEKLTHQRPVLDADGVPIHEGDTVYLLPGEWCGEYPLCGYSDGDEMAVKELCPDHEVGGVLRCAGDGKCNCFPLPYQLTHTKPEPIDTWERIEDDAGCTATKYNERRGTIFTTKQQVARDLVRRCRALAERERGE